MFVRNDQIAAYIDGEFLPREELELEMHFAGCEKLCGGTKRTKKIALRSGVCVRKRKGISTSRKFHQNSYCHR